MRVDFENYKEVPKKEHKKLYSLLIEIEELNGLLDKLKELENNGYRIKSLDITAISEDGAKFAKNLGLDLYKELEDGNKLFI